MINLLIIFFLLLSVVILKCGFEMFIYHRNKGYMNSTNTFQEQMAFIPKYINVTNEEDGKVGIWFR